MGGRAGGGAGAGGGTGSWRTWLKGVTSTTLKSAITENKTEFSKLSDGDKRTFAQLVVNNRMPGSLAIRLIKKYSGK